MLSVASTKMPATSPPPVTDHCMLPESPNVKFTLSHSEGGKDFYAFECSVAFTRDDGANSGRVVCVDNHDGSPQWQDTAGRPLEVLPQCTFNTSIAIGIVVPIPLIIIIITMVCLYKKEKLKRRTQESRKRISDLGHAQRGDDDDVERYLHPKSLRRPSASRQDDVFDDITVSTPPLSPVHFPRRLSDDPPRLTMTPLSMNYVERPRSPPPQSLRRPSVGRQEVALEDIPLSAPPLPPANFQRRFSNDPPRLPMTPAPTDDPSDDYIRPGYAEDAVASCEVWTSRRRTVYDNDDYAVPNFHVNPTFQIQKSVDTEDTFDSDSESDGGAANNRDRCTGDNVNTAQENVFDRNANLYDNNLGGETVEREYDEVCEEDVQTTL